MKELHFRTLGWGWVAIIVLIMTSWIIYINDRYGQFLDVWEYINPAWDWIAFIVIVNLFNFAGEKFAENVGHQKQPTKAERSFMIQVMIIVQLVMLLMFYNWLTWLLDYTREGPIILK